VTTSKQLPISEIFSEQDLLVFDRETRSFLEKPEQLQYVVEPRITAVEVVLIYEQGALKSASAQTGPVTASVKTILTVPLTFVPLRKGSPVPDYLEIMADVYMEDAALARLNQERRAKNLQAFSDSRGAVEDSLHQTDARISAKRPLNYFCSGSGKRAGVPAATHYELMLALQELGLRVNRPHIEVCNGIHEVIDRCRRLRAEAGNFPYPVQGALIQVNFLGLQERLGRASANLKGKAVFRF
jgi:DNA ligase (NAD+)